MHVEDVKGTTCPLLSLPLPSQWLACCGLSFPYSTFVDSEADCFCLPQAAGKIHVSEGGLGHQPFGQLGLF